jgi:hypothetical protein
VVDDEIDDHADAAHAGLLGELDEVPQRPEARIDAVVVGDVVAVVAVGGRVKGRQPDGRDPDTSQVVEAPHQPLEVPHPIAVGVHEGADVEAVKDGVLVPEVVDHPGTR